MIPVSTAALSRFAALPGGASPGSQGRSGLAAFFLAPFIDVDERPARKAAAVRAERAARRAAMSAAAE